MHAFRKFAGLMLVLLAVPAQAQTYPSRPIRLITPFPPGATTDALSRIVAQKLQESWGHNVLVDNRPGATGMLGTDLAAKAAPDGYTLVTVISSHLVHKHLYKKVPFDAIADFEPVIPLARVTNVLVLHNSVPATDARSFIALAKARKGQLVYGTAGSGSSNHLSAEMFKQVAGVPMEHIPYKGGAPAMNDLLGGQIPVMMASLPTALPHVRTGRIRALLVTSGKRQRSLPDVPTLQELGYTGTEADEWWAILAPAGTPKDIVGKLNAEIARSFELPDVKERINNLSVEYMGGSPEAFGNFMRAESVRWEKIIRNAGIKPES